MWKHRDIGSLELTEEIIRQRAYQLYIERGCQPGHDWDDWLQAEAEVMGTKPRRAEMKPQRGKTAAA